MLTVREPLFLKTARPMTRLSPVFGEKIERNYDMAVRPATGEELLYLMEEAPLITVVEGSRIQMTQSHTDNRKHVAIQTVNQVLNRLLLWNEVNFTYQDQIYIERQLRRMGIRDVPSFLKQVSERCEGCREEYQLIKKYENLGRVFQKAAVSMEMLRDNKGSGSHDAEGEALAFALYRDIYRRLDTEKIYKETGIFYRNQVAGNETTAPADETLRFAEYERVGLLLKLEAEKMAALGRAPEIPEPVNPYELVQESNGFAAETAEQMKRQLTSAVLLNLAELVSIHRFREPSDIRREWTDFRYAFPGTVVSTLKRFEEYHRENRHFTVREYEFQEETRKLRKAEEVFLGKFERLWESGTDGEEGTENFSKILQESMELVLDRREKRQEEQAALQERSEGMAWNLEPGNVEREVPGREAVMQKSVLVQEESHREERKAAGKNGEDQAGNQVENSPERPAEEQTETSDSMLEGKWETAPGFVNSQLTVIEEKPLELTFLQQQEAGKGYFSTSEKPEDQASVPPLPSVSRKTLTYQLALAVEQMEDLAKTWESIAITAPGLQNAKETRTPGAKDAGLFLKRLEKETVEIQQKFLTKQWQEQRPPQIIRTEQTIEIQNTGDGGQIEQGSAGFKEGRGFETELIDRMWPEPASPAGWELSPMEIELARNPTETTEPGNKTISPQDDVQADHRLEEIKKYLENIRKQAVSSRQKWTETHILKKYDVPQHQAEEGPAYDMAGTAISPAQEPLRAGASWREIRTYADQIGVQTTSRYQEFAKTQLLKTTEALEGGVNLELVRDAAELMDLSGQESPQEAGREPDIKRYLDKINEQNILKYRELSETQMWKAAVPVKKVPDMTRMREESRQVLTDPAGMLEHVRNLSIHPTEASEDQSKDRQQLEVILKHADDTTRYIYEQIWNYNGGGALGQGASPVRPVSPIQLVTDLNKVMEERREQILLTNREYPAETELPPRLTGKEEEPFAAFARNGSMAEEGISRPAPTASIVYKQPSAPITGELLEQLVKKQEIQVRKEIKSSIAGTSVNQQKEAVKQTELMKNRSVKELQALIEKGISKQMGTISEIVYHRLEKKMERELARRGR